MKASGESRLATFAVRTASGGEREHSEPPDPLRPPFERDRHRIVESTAFRRLERKTQVFTAAHHDHFRTRLTHTLEVTQIARTLAVVLEVNEPLVEAISLAHDLGHPPFGHAGEAALDDCMHDHGGFNHNTHALRVVEYLEHPFPQFRGLNLTRAVRAGLGMHESRYDIPLRHSGAFPIPSRPSVEAQIASVADRLAYNCHDLEDAIGAGFVGFEHLATLPLWTRAAETVRPLPPGAVIHAVRRLILDNLLNIVLCDVIETSRTRLTRVPSAEQAATAPTPLVPSDAMNEELYLLEEFLLEHVYRHPEVSAMDARGRRMVRGLFAAYRNQVEALPPRFLERVAEQGHERVICDYISGMTDRFCANEFERLVGVPG